jgi:hypothetical protein
MLAQRDEALALDGCVNQALAETHGVVWAVVAALVYGVLRLLDRKGFPNSVPMRALGFTLTAMGTLLVSCALVARDASALGVSFALRTLRGLGRYPYAVRLSHVVVALSFELSGLSLQRVWLTPHSLLAGEFRSSLWLELSATHSPPSRSAWSTTRCFG